MIYLKITHRVFSKQNKKCSRDSLCCIFCTSKFQDEIGYEIPRRIGRSPLTPAFLVADVIKFKTDPYFARFVKCACIDDVVRRKQEQVSVVEISI